MEQELNRLTPADVARLNLVNTDGQGLEKRLGLGINGVLFPSLLVTGEQLHQDLTGLMVIKRAQGLPKIGGIHGVFPSSSFSVAAVGISVVAPGSASSST